MLSNSQLPSLASKTEQDRRLALMSATHMKDLSDYVKSLRAQLPNGTQIPDFDPCDGGTDARALFLFEAPQRQVTSGFISQENPDPSATYYHGLFTEAGIDRNNTVVWNVVPWIVQKSIDATDVGRALPHLKKLLKSLPKLEVIVLLGKQSWKAETALKSITRANIKRSYTVSPFSFNRHGKRPEVLTVFQEVAAILNPKTPATSRAPTTHSARFPSPAPR